jgi:RHS repeat-associated protein
MVPNVTKKEVWARTKASPVYNDSLSGLDYYHACYYDPVAAVFLSADVAQGTITGMNPNDYVGDNPETQ